MLLGRLSGKLFASSRSAAPCAVSRVPAPAPATNGFRAATGRPLPGLSLATGSCLDRELRAKNSRLETADLRIEGLERVATADLALSLDWRTERSWPWKGRVHINILESSTISRLFLHLALEGGPLRFANLCDSNVARCAVVKGRSPSQGLRHSARRASSISLAAGLYHGGLFCPTRWIPADAPSRSKPLPPPVENLGPDFWSREAFLQDAVRPGSGVGLRIGSAFPLSSFLSLPPSGPGHLRAAGLPCRSEPSPLLACSTPPLAFRVRVRLPLAFGLCFCPAFRSVPPLPPGRLTFREFGFGFVALSAPAGAMEARTLKAEAERRTFRAGLELERGRPVQRTTRSRREKLKAAFSDWLRPRGRTWEGLRTLAHHDVDQLNEIFIWFGQWLFEEGKPYYHYAETLNAFTLDCPSVRRLLQPSWDLAFAWQRHEPPTHHTAMPWQVLLALIAVCYVWGWDDVAGLLAICWGGLARVGEVLAARRRDLVLPADVGLEAVAGVQQVFLSVLEAKTRFKAARHQCLKIDQPQLVESISFAFGRLGPGALLWPRSGSALRLRFKKLLVAIGLSNGAVDGVRDFDLASLRAGGATWLMNVTESPDFVRRRGRWITNKVMEIYVQEVSAMMYLPRLEQGQRENIFAWANSFQAAFQFAKWSADLHLSPSLRHTLLQHGVYNA